MRNKTVLITGGTSGIGMHTAIGLAALGAHVIVTGRDRTRGEQGLATIRQRSGSTAVDLLLADMSSQAAIHQLADEVTARFPRLDVLINNVGLLEATRRLTVDGIEAHLAVNVLAPYLLTMRLRPLLEASRPARVITLSGGMPFAKIDLDNLQAEKSFTGLTTYTHAKFVMMAMSVRFARELQGSGVSLNVVYPGTATTNMTRDMTPAMVPPMLRMAWPVFRLMFGDAETTAAKAARSSIHAASSPTLEGVSGAYFDTNGKPTNWPSTVQDEHKQQRIWEVVERLTAQPVGVR